MDGEELQSCPGIQAAVQTGQDEQKQPRNPIQTSNEKSK